MLEDKYINGSIREFSIQDFQRKLFPKKLESIKLINETNLVSYYTTAHLLNLSHFLKVLKGNSNKLI